MNNMNGQEGILSFCLNLLAYPYMLGNFNSDDNFKLNMNFNFSNEINLKKKTKIFETNTEENASSSVPDSENMNVADENKMCNKKTAKNKAGRKLFKCTFDSCEKSFDYKWILDRHINSHFCFKLYKCDFEGCSKAYKSKENLNLHYKNKHLGEKPYKCRFCISRFSHRNGKTYHERKVHINFLPHACTINGCDLKFASKSALNYHMINQH